MSINIDMRNAVMVIYQNPASFFLIYSSGLLKNFLTGCSGKRFKYR